MSRQIYAQDEIGGDKKPFFQRDVRREKDACKNDRCISLLNSLAGNSYDDQLKSSLMGHQNKTEDSIKSKSRYCLILLNVSSGNFYRPVVLHSSIRGLVLISAISVIVRELAVLAP